MPATEKMHTENTESSFSVFFVCILQWPALSFIASNFEIEVESSSDDTESSVLCMGQAGLSQNKASGIVYEDPIPFACNRVGPRTVFLTWIPKLDWFIRLNRLDSVDL